MNEFLFIMPELCLVLTLFFIVIGEITFFKEKTRLAAWISLFGLISAFIEVLILNQYGNIKIFNSALVVDGFSLFFKLFVILLSVLTICGIFQTKEIPNQDRIEYCVLVLAATFVMCLLVSVADLILSFLLLLFLNLISYFLVVCSRPSLSSIEAGIKYLAFGSVSIVLFLYALGLLFISTKVLNIYEIHKVLISVKLSPSVMLAVFTLSLMTFSFQIGCFPMHWIVPDILEGAPTPLAAFLALGGRVSSLVFATRFFIAIFNQTNPMNLEHVHSVGYLFDWTQIVAFSSGVTMLAGGLLAFRQQSAKRLVSYLVMVETGFFLLSLLILDKAGFTALLYQLLVDLFALVGCFYILTFFVDHLGSDRFDSMKGLLSLFVPESLCLILFLLCLTGSPPFPGFIGKFALISLSVQHGWNVLALVSCFTLVLSLSAVFRMVYYLIGSFEKVSFVLIPVKPSQRIFLSLISVPLLLLSIFANFILNLTGKSLDFIFS